MRGVKQLRFETGPVSDMREEPDERSCGLAWKSGPNQAYDEEAFHYFLAIERKRSERSGRPLLLLLVDGKGQLRRQARVDTALSEKLFSALSLCLRDTDFIGWYREERVAAAVLTQRAESPGVDISVQVSERVIRTINEHLSKADCDRLVIRVRQLPFRLRNRR